MTGVQTCALPILTTASPLASSLLIFTTSAGIVSAVANGISTFKIAVALAVGIALVLGIPLPQKRR